VVRIGGWGEGILEKKKKKKKKKKKNREPKLSWGGNKLGRPKNSEEHAIL